MSKGRRRPYRGTRIDRNTKTLHSREEADWTRATTAQAARRDGLKWPGQDDDQDDDEEPGQ